MFVPDYEVRGGEKMKSKKSLLSLGLLALVLVLGVGYAVVSEVYLEIGGTATVAGSDLAVSFVGKEETTEGKVTSSATEGSLEASINVDGLVLNEKVSATYTVQNKETDVNASVQKKSITVEATDGTDLSSYFEVTTDVDSTAKTVAAQGTETVTVNVKLKKTPVEHSSANVTVVLEATPIEKAN